MSSFWLILKQQWTIEEISIFSNSSHLEWRAWLSNTILKGTHPGTIPARFGLIWFSGFRGEDLNVKVWPGELKKNSYYTAHCHLITIYMTSVIANNCSMSNEQVFMKTNYIILYIGNTWDWHCTLVYIFSNS